MQEQHGSDSSQHKNNGIGKMYVKKDASEILTYTIHKLPIKAFTTHQTDYPTLSVVNHWHDDFEFGYIRKGRMFYSVNGEGYELTEGQMIFVNSQQMHYNYWTEIEECEFSCIVLHPSLIYLKPYTEQFFDALCGEKKTPFVILSPNSATQREIIDTMLKLHLLCMDQMEGYEMEMTGLAGILCGQITRYIKSNSNAPVMDSKRIRIMHEMVGYIQNNYSKRITLNDIAFSGLVCRSRCCDIFKEFLGKSPNEYLTEYRIERSIALLSESDKSVTEIALLCGFSGSSYFAETFRKQIGCTPSEYRNEKCLHGEAL